MWYRGPNFNIVDYILEPFLKKEDILTEVKENNVVSLATGQAFDGGAGSDNWLSELELYSVFLARPVLKLKPGERIDPMSRLILNAYFIQEIHDEVVNLLWRTPDGKQLDIWVRSLEFSRLMEFVKLIAVIKPDTGEETFEQD